MANMKSSKYIRGSVVDVNGKGRVIKKLGRLFKKEIESIRTKCHIKGEVESPVAIWNDVSNPPAPQFLHSDGAAMSVFIPVSELGRQLDVLALFRGEFLRVRVHIPYGTVLKFNASVFHGGAPGNDASPDPCIHFYVETSADEETFLHRALHCFRLPVAQNYMPDGMVCNDGTLNMAIVRKNGVLPLEHFKDIMVGWYPGCNEWPCLNSTDASTYEFKKCSYDEFVDGTLLTQAFNIGILSN